MSFLAGSGRRLVAAPLCTALVCGLIVGSSVAAGGGAQRLWVDDDGMAGPRSCDSSRPAFTSIQEAVDAAQPGATIRVCPGSYSEEVTVAGTDGLRIRSTEPGAAVVQPPLGGGSAGLLRPNGVGGSSVFTVVGTDGIRIRGFTLRAPSSGYCERVSAMVNITGGSKDAVIRDDVIRAGGSDTLGDCGYDDGIVVANGSSALVRDNLVKDFQGAGITVLSSGTEATLTGNQVAYHHAHAPTQGTAKGIGIQVVSAKLAVLEGNTIDGLESAELSGPGTPLLGTGIHGFGSTDGLRIRGSQVEDGWTGISLVSVAGALIEDNDFRHNRDVDCKDDSSGYGTAGTANTWTGNLGSPYKSFPEGLCSLP